MILNAGGVFYSIETERFLFLLRTEGKQWGFVGGGVEQNESPVDGLMREITEEIGFTPIIQKTIPLDLYTNKNFIYHTFVLIVDHEFIPILNGEHNGYAWVNIDSFPKPLHPGVFNTLKIEEIRDKISIIVQIYQ